MACKLDFDDDANEALKEVMPRVSFHPHFEIFGPQKNQEIGKNYHRSQARKILDENGCGLQKIIFGRPPDDQNELYFIPILQITSFCNILTTVWKKLL